jgi:PKD repeat protein
MKYTLLFFSLSMICLEMLPTISVAQNQDQSARKSEILMTKPVISSGEVIFDTRKTEYLITRQGLINQSKKSITKTPDTLNYPLEGTEALYISDEGGYVTGNNEYGDVAKANFYETTEVLSLSGIIFDFAYATGGTPEIEVVVWDNTGTNDSPGTVLATSTINLNVIKNDVANQQMTYIPFDPPVIVTSSFYAGVMLPETIGDTLAIWSNTDGDTNPGIAWEKWNTDIWVPVSSNLTWSLDIAMAIFPVIDPDVPLTAIFTSNLTQVPIGQSVSFQDLSAGSPTAWEWIFEGGEPGTSALQNPVVTYNEAGSFNVTLTVWKDAANDSKTVSDYITVGGSQVEIDTLNYPLAGQYAVYITNGNAFVTGNNEYGDRAKANFFQNNQNRFITGVLLEFAYATGGNPDIEIALWDNTGTNGKPGAKIGSKIIPLNTIKNQITNQQFTYAAIDPPVNVSSSFYAGFQLPTTTGDTLVVWSNMDGETNPGIAWEQWNDLQWYSFTHPDSWGLNLALAVFPIVHNTLGLDENRLENVIRVFPNPSNNVFTIFSEAFDGESLHLFVYRTDGTLVRNTIHGMDEVLTVDLENEPAGIYFLKVTTGSKFFTAKLIKQ